LTALSASSSGRKQKKSRRLITPPIVPLARNIARDYAPVIAGTPQMSSAPIVFSLPALLFPSALEVGSLLNLALQGLFVAFVGIVVVSGQYSSPEIKDIFSKSVSSTRPQSTTISSPSTTQTGSFTVVLNGKQPVTSGTNPRSSQVIGSVPYGSPASGIVVQGTSAVQSTINTALPLTGTVNKTLGTVNGTISIVNGTVQTTLSTVNHTTKTVTSVVPTTLKTVTTTVKTITSTVPTTLKTVTAPVKTVTSTIPTTLKTVSSTTKKTVTSIVPTTLKTDKKTGKNTRSTVSSTAPGVVKKTSKVGKTVSETTHHTTKVVKNTVQKSGRTVSTTTHATTVKPVVKTVRSTATSLVPTKGTKH